MAAVTNLLLFHLRSGKWSEIFLLSVDAMAGEKTKYFVGVKGAVLRA